MPNGVCRGLLLRGAEGGMERRKVEDPVPELSLNDRLERLP